MGFNPISLSGIRVYDNISQKTVENLATSREKDSTIDRIVSDIVRRGYILLVLSRRTMTIARYNDTGAVDNGRAQLNITQRKATNYTLYVTTRDIRIMLRVSLVNHIDIVLYEYIPFIIMSTVYIYKHRRVAMIKHKDKERIPR